MRNEVVRKGVSRIIVAQFLTIATLIFEAGLLGVAYFADRHIGDPSIEVSSTKSFVLLLAAMCITDFTGLIIYISGVRKASKEEPKFKSAIKFIVLSIVFSFLKILIFKTPFYYLSTVLSLGMDYLAIVCIIEALSFALDNDPGSIGSINGVSVIIKICYIATAVLAVVRGIFSGSDSIILTIVVDLIVNLLQIIATITFITQLRQAE